MDKGLQRINVLEQELKELEKQKLEVEIKRMHLKDGIQLQINIENLELEINLKKEEIEKYRLTPTKLKNVKSAFKFITTSVMFIITTIMFFNMPIPRDMAAFALITLLVNSFVVIDSTLLYYYKKIFSNRKFSKLSLELDKLSNELNIEKENLKESNVKADELYLTRNLILKKIMEKEKEIEKIQQMRTTAINYFIDNNKELVNLLNETYDTQIIEKSNQKVKKIK